MDAVKRHSAVLLELLVRRPLIVCVLALSYAFVAIASAITDAGPWQGLVIAFMAAIPAAGLFPIATHRLIDYAASAGAPGTPYLAQTLRAAQVGLLVLLVFLPWLVAIAHHAPWLGAAAVLLAGAAFGTSRVMMGLFVGLLIAASWVHEHTMSPDHWLPAVQYLVVAGSVTALWRWLQLPERLQAAAPTVQVACSASYREAEAEMAAAKQTPTEISLAQLLDLKPTAESARLPNTVTPRGIVLKCLNMSARTQTYCSRLVMTDRSSRIEWRLDFRQPDSFHVAQAAWAGQSAYGVDHDEWITLGTEHYIRPAVWLQNDEQRNDQLNQFLLLDKYLALLRALDPSSAQVSSRHERLYLCMEYRLHGIDDSNLWDSLFKHSISTAFAPCQIFIWLDLESNLVAKAQLLLKDAATNGSQIAMEIHQAFTGYGQDVKVTRPLVGLKPAGNKPGSYIVTDNRVFPTPFHG